MLRNSAGVAISRDAHRLGNWVNKSSALARELAARTNEVGGPFGNGQDGGLRIAGYSRRHDRRIDDPQAGNADYAQPRIDDCARIPAEAARTDGVKRSGRLSADVREGVSDGRRKLNT